jgi:hypothetical protein
MQILDRKDLVGVKTSLLLKLKNTLFKRIEITSSLNKDQTKMLVDILSEIDFRKDNDVLLQRY